jgi:RNA polymerase sigma-70 factor (ECF subfamily)
MSRIGSDELRDLQHAHGAALLAYFHRRVEPAEEAAVLLNDLLLVLWRRAASAPTEPEEVRMWMFGIARKLVQNHHRSSRRQDALTTRLRDQISMLPTPRAYEDVIDVRNAVSALPRAQAELVRLVHWDGFSLVQAAAITGVSASTARSRYQLARKRLARELALTEEEPARAQLGYAPESGPAPMMKMTGTMGSFD